MRWAIVKDDKIINIISWDGVTPWQAPEDCELINIDNVEPNPGSDWLYDSATQTFYAPPPPAPIVPTSITRRQCSLELFNRQLITGAEALEMTKNGTPPAAIMAYINTLTPDEQIRAQIDFAAENYFRNNELLIAIMTANNMSPSDIDDFFIAASKL